jgi:hypothetical protein
LAHNNPARTATQSSRRNREDCWTSSVSRAGMASSDSWPLSYFWLKAEGQKADSFSCRNCATRLIVTYAYKRGIESAEIVKG